MTQKLATVQRRVSQIQDVAFAFRVRPQRLLLRGHFATATSFDLIGFGLSGCRDSVTDFTYALPKFLQHAECLNSILAKLNRLQTLTIDSELIKAADFKALRGCVLSGITLDRCNDVQCGAMYALAEMLDNHHVKFIRLINIDAKNSGTAVQEFMLAFGDVWSCQESVEELTISAIRPMSSAALVQFCRLFPNLRLLDCNATADNYANCIGRLLQNGTTPSEGFTLRGHGGDIDKTAFFSTVHQAAGVAVQIEERTGTAARFSLNNRSVLFQLD